MAAVRAKAEVEVGSELSQGAQVVLVSNGPGELYTWVKPVLEELRRVRPDLRVAISLIPCQFAAGDEASIAATFEPDFVTTPGQYLRAAAVGSAPPALLAATRPEPGDAVQHGLAANDAVIGLGGNGAVIGLGGNGAMAVALGKRLGYPAYRYSFEPYWHAGLSRLLLPDEQMRKRAVRGGAPKDKATVVGNLVADATQASSPVADRGHPHVLLFGGSRDGFALHLIPLLIALVDRLAPELPDARFVWPVSRLLKEQTIADGVAGRYRATLHGVAGQRDGDVIVTPAGGRLELVPEEDRYAHMRAADLAVTIPGTNTLELGVAGVPALVLLPLNQPELIPLEGVGHWLGLVPLVGKYLKRYAVRLFVEGLKVPVSLPNRISGEDLMVELRGKVNPELVAERTLGLLADPDDLARRRARLLATMPAPGAAKRLVELVLADSGLARSDVAEEVTAVGGRSSSVQTGAGAVEPGTTGSAA